MSGLDALVAKRGGSERRRTRNRTSYGHMHNWLHSHLSGHTLSNYRDPDSAIVSDGSASAATVALVSQRASQTPEQPPELSAEAELTELRQCMTERDRNRHGVNYEVGAQSRRAWPALPAPRPHDQQPPFHLPFGAGSNGYDDAHKNFLKLESQNDRHCQPKLRNGKGGSTWRHLKFPLQPNGERRQFLDGQVSLSDMYRQQLKGRDIQTEGNRRNQTQQRQIDTRQFVAVRRPTAKQGVEHNNWLIMR